MLYATVVLKKVVFWKSLQKRHWDNLNCTNLYLILEVIYIYVFQRLQRCAVLEGFCLWPSPSRVHWPSLVLLSFITMGRVMASPRPPHSAWLRCQHQASHAIKQLAPFINLTSTIYRRGSEDRKQRWRERGDQLGGRYVEWEKSSMRKISISSHFICWLFLTA